MGVNKYLVRNKPFFRIDTWIPLPDGTSQRVKKGKFPTREQAEAYEKKLQVEAFEGRYFDRVKEPSFTVTDLWKEYEVVTKRDNDSWQSDEGRSRHLLRHLGKVRATRLTLADIDRYRTSRLGETTRLGRAPSPATLDREVELLKRFLNYSVACKKLPKNPIADVQLLRVPNTRQVVLGEEAFQRLVAAAEEWLRPILLVAFDTGMRKSEVLKLKWRHLDRDAGAVRLGPEDTKTEKGRFIYLTKRVQETLAALPRHAGSEYVFVNPDTGERYKEIQAAVERARHAAGLDGMWTHDLRRSFITNARRAGIPQRVIMSMSGHLTDAAFKRYDIVEEEDQRRAVQRLDELRSGPVLGRVDGT